MGYRLRDLDAERKFSSTLSLEAIATVVTQDTINAVLQQHHAVEIRERRLCMSMVVWVLIAMNIYSNLSIAHVLRKVSQGLRFIWPEPEIEPANKSAFSYRRYQLGPAALASLFQQVARPLANPATPGAFLFGYQLMAIDGTVDVLPDTPANDAFFGRATSDRGPSAFPQVRSVYLAECGTHAIVDAEFLPYLCSERDGGSTLLRSIDAGMLVLWDRGFHSFELIAALLQRGAALLERLPAHVKPRLIQKLADGSQLAWLVAPDSSPAKDAAPIAVRIIEYTLTDPALPGYKQRHRLLTTLLDPLAAPALELVYAYHERWEIEILIDEVQTHQRLNGKPLRSKKPSGVLQELYGLLLAHYAVRKLMYEAAASVNIDPDRLSFVHAVRVLQDAIPEFQMVAAAELPRLYNRMLGDIAKGRLPERQLRSNPRVVKRKMSKFRLKRAEHDHWPQPTLPFKHAIALI